MRGPPLVLLLLALLLSGCATPNAPTDAASRPGPGDPGADPGSTPTLPEPIEASETVVGSADPLIFVGDTPCTTPNAGCRLYPFTVAAPARAAAELTWTNPASDFDLYVLLDGQPVSMQGTNVVPGPHTSATVVEDLGPGEYEVAVVPFAVAQDTFSLVAGFAAPE